MKKIILLTFLVFISSVAGYSDTIAYLGKVGITDNDFRLRYESYSKCYNQRIPKDSTDIMAELIRDFMEYAVLIDAYNITVPDSVLEKRAAFIDTLPELPQNLNCIKNIYSGYRSEYLKNLALPALVNKILSIKFNDDYNIHKKQKDSIEYLWALATNTPPDKLKEFREYDSVIFLKDIKSDTADQLRLSGGRDLLLDSIISKMKPGNMWKNIVETEYSFMLITMIEENDTSYKCGIIKVNKITMSEWISNYFSNSLKIIFKEAVFSEKLKRKFPDVWWIKSLK